MPSTSCPRSLKTSVGRRPVRRESKAISCNCGCRFSRSSRSALTSSLVRKRNLSLSAFTIFQVPPLVDKGLTPPHACGDGTVYGGTHKAEDVVDGLPDQHFPRRCFGFRPFGGLFGLCIPSRRFQKLRLEAGKQIRSQIGNRQSVDFGLEVGAILAVGRSTYFPSFCPRQGRRSLSPRW